ncbi:MAG: T9SS type A sorting domain-containing protein [Saprospiraceae bacterium]|nr:T9SS type A sorting domain-containing protein [Bacteroidia bacterium]NNE14844.1 T9SS type A sorting domain-containing protein [Saprospiraceae bacterium]NNL90594.1 T9SS type A sorting domain-containing protein [Saprospiraceae bacterium]
MKKIIPSFLLFFLSYTSIFSFGNTLTVEVTVTDTNCDTSEGEIDVTVTGGTPPYTIMPSNLTNLSAGNYDLTITDSGSCVYDTTVTVSEINNLSHFVDVLDEITCDGNQTADIIINVAGGSGSYIVMIDENPSISEVSTGVFSTMLGAGSYGITITDLDDNCMDVDNFAVGQPSAIIIEAEILAIDSCSGEIEQLDIVVNGGTPPYMIDTNPQNDGVLITVTDDNNCTEELFVENPEVDNALIFSEILIFQPDPGDDNGSIDITVSGGTPPYVYLWRDADGNDLSTEEDIDFLFAGIYEVQVSDSNGCSILSGDIVLDDISSTVDVSIKKFAIYPNPIHEDNIYIKGTNQINATYSLYSQSGQLMKQNKIHNFENQINLNDVPDGMYYLKIQSDQHFEVHSIFKM